MAESIREHLKTAGVTRTRIFARTTTDEPVDFRTLRDTYATWSALQGIPITTLQRRLGHEDMATTNGYVKAAEAFSSASVGSPFPELPEALWTTDWTTKEKNPDFHRGSLVARVGFEHCPPPGPVGNQDFPYGEGSENGAPDRGLDQPVGQLFDGHHGDEMALYGVLERSILSGEWPSRGEA